ncbi:hypothetical protein D3C80_1533810 [compost metagenome]
MDIKNKEAFESKFKLNAIYERESRIRKNNILEFAETAGIYFNIVTNNAWELWQAAQAQAVPEGFILVPQEPTELFKEHLKNHLFDLWAGDHGCDWDGFVSVDAINHNTIWKMMIETQEQS